MYECKYFCCGFSATLEEPAENSFCRFNKIELEGFECENCKNKIIGDDIKNGK